MLKKTLKYVNFNNEEVEEDLYFNLTQVEAVRLDLEFDGLEAYIEKMTVEERIRDIMFLFERLLKTSFGEKSEDGKFFIKNEEVQDRFMQSAAYDALFTSMMQNTDLAIEFFTEVVSTAMPRKVD